MSKAFMSAMVFVLKNKPAWQDLPANYYHFVVAYSNLIHSDAFCKENIDAFVKSRHPGPHIREDKLQPGSREYLTH